MVSFSLFNSISDLPKASTPEDVTYLLQSLSEAAQIPDDLLQSVDFECLVAALAGNAPYLARLIQLQQSFLLQLCEYGIEAGYEWVMSEMTAIDLHESKEAEVMRELRIAKQRMSLLTAIADIGGIWPVMEVTRRLSFFAEKAVNIVLDYLLLDAQRSGELQLQDSSKPQVGCRILVLAMGKLGAYELNYSSDIDLIVLFDKDEAPYCGPRNVQQLYTRITQDLVHMMESRTAEGYVFRTDLRLRPDPRSMPLAVNVHAAISYYESVGQNWERAAMIKARHIAGDVETNALFKEHIQPYIWRKALDFESIKDIQSIKRQMTVRVGEAIAVGGHNIKLGRGGIREIEFYVQTQQLLWGGRYPELRERSTLGALKCLVEMDLLTQSHADLLSHAYQFLRRVEHYIQMMDDQQTHTLPEDMEDLRRLSVFLNYESLDDFKSELKQICTQVHELYSESLEGTEPLSIDGNLVFTGVEPDPETLVTLSNMGYQSPESVSDIIQSWHRGSRRSTKGKRARQILTELIPALLQALSNTANPDSAFFRFDDFIARLPTGVQIFSLLNARPELLGVIARILGSAPALGQQLAKHPHLLDTVLHTNFYAKLPDKQSLQEELEVALSHIENYEDRLAALRSFKNEKHFQAGLHMLQGNASSVEIGAYLSDIAEVIVSPLVQMVVAEFEESYGQIPGGKLGIAALGKFGSRELTFGSDLDLVFIYDVTNMSVESDGEKPLDPRTYYNRLCARIVTAFTMRDREGLLYEVDTRLRPSGGDSPIATQRKAFDDYFSEKAWVFEYMALTKARIVVATDDAYAHNLMNDIHRYLQRDYGVATLRHEIYEMRSKIAQQYGTENHWHIKYVRGGLVDLDFIAQYLVLRHAKACPAILKPHTFDIISAARENRLLEVATADELLKAQQLLSGLLSFLRLCSDGEIHEDTAPIGLKNLLVERFERTDFDELKDDLLAMQAYVYAQFEVMLGAG